MASMTSQCTAAIFLMLAISAASRTLPQANIDFDMAKKYDQWIAEYSIQFKDNTEKEKRFDVFRQNVEFIDSFNAAGDKPYRLGLNAFTHLTNEEFVATHSGSLPTSTPRNSSTPFRYQNVTIDDVPASIDWREKGAVTNVRNQGTCGACWAFAAVAAVEGIIQIDTGSLPTLSEQELIDCDTGGSDHGCTGGHAIYAFEFVAAHGLTSESTYPYVGSQGSCNSAAEASPAGQIKGHERVPYGSEEDLLSTVANQPVYVSIDNRGPAFQSYKSGVFTGPCGTDTNHAVTVVGYGTTPDGIKYWLVKNSWGTDWGEQGYVKMQRDVAAEEGLCGLATKATYPTGGILG